VFFDIIERDLGNANNSFSSNIFTIFVKGPIVNLLTITKIPRPCCVVANTMKIVELICAAVF
jgi:hypothetical protein